MIYNVMCGSNEFKQEYEASKRILQIVSIEEKWDYEIHAENETQENPSARYCG